MKIRTALWALFLLPVAAFSEEHLAIAGRDVAWWKPTGPAPASGYPVVVFSHGLTGCNTQSTFLMEALAKAGYLVLAPNHEDARCGTARTGKLRGLKTEAPLGSPEKWSEATYRDRADDVKAVLDAALRDSTFHGLAVAAQRVGLAGHSLGGYTVLGLAGAWPAWKDARVKAVLALSAFCTPYVSNGDLSRLKMPVMYQGGTLDLGITPSIRRFQGAYDRSVAPKYYVEFDGAGHFAWTDLNPRFHAVIDEYSIAFFDRYLKGKNPDRLDALINKPLPKLVSFLKSDDKVR